MHSVVVKLVVTPLLIGGASLAGRRWGHQVGGRLIALPLTSGPVAFFLALALTLRPLGLTAFAVATLAALAAQAGTVFAIPADAPRGAATATPR